MPTKAPAKKRADDDEVVNLEALGREIQTELEAQKASRTAIDERLARLESAAKTTPRMIGGMSGLSEDEAKRFSVLRYIGGLLRERSGDDKDRAWKGADVERKVRDAMSSQNDTAGASLVPPETDPMAIEFLRPEVVTLALGARTVEPTGQPYRIPEIVSGASGSWVGANEEPAESRMTTGGPKELRPRKYGMLVKVDEDLLRYANPSIEAAIRRDLTAKSAEVMDLAFLLGSGAGGQPKGLLRYAELLDAGDQNVAIGANGGDPTFKLLSKMLGVLEDANALKGKIGFASHPKIRRVLKQERIAQFSGDTDGAYAVPALPIMSDKVFQDLVGHPWLTTTQLPTDEEKGSSSDCSPIVAGNWDDFQIAKWGGVDIRPLFELGAAKGQVWFVVFFRVDCIPLRIESFVSIRDARTNNA